MSHINASNGRNFIAPYTYSEYPKWVKLADGSSLVVHDEDEESAAVTADGDDVEAVREEVKEREQLFAQAKSLGLKPHHKMRIERLRDLIATGRS